MDIDLKKLAGSPRTKSLTEALAGKAAGRALWTRQFAASGKAMVGKIKAV